MDRITEYIGKQIVGRQSGKNYTVIGIGNCGSPACEGGFEILNGFIHFSNVDWYATKILNT